MLDKYKKQKDNLLNQYDKLLTTSNLFPFKTLTDRPITKDDIKEKKRQLENEHFIVSITGQIKAGKSTLINAFVFRKEILPSDDTPQTAKLTILKYSKHSKIEISFYNSREWIEIKNSAYFKEYIAPYVEKSMQKGINPNELILSEPLVKEDSIKNLDDYVSKNGKYQPFVNTVTVYYPSNILKEIVIVDTPGTNDPNPVRSKATTDWIKKTNANIYLIYAGQAFTQDDIDFIDKYLISIPAELKLTVINKIDTVENINHLKLWLKELVKGDLKNREIYNNEEDIILVSGLGALIDALDKDQEKLSDELEFYADLLDEKGFLDPKKHNIDELKLAIERKLIELKGKNIINSHQRFIDSLFEEKINYLKSKIDIENSHIMDVEKDKNDLKSAINKLEKIQEIFESNMKVIKDFIKTKTRDIIDDFYGKLTEFFNEIENDIKILIDNLETSNILASMKSLKWDMKKIFENRNNDLINMIKNIEKQLISELNKKVADLKKDLLNINKEELNIDFILKDTIKIISSREIIEDVKRYLDIAFTENVFEEIYNANEAIFFNTTSNYNKMKEELKEKTSENMAEIKDTIVNKSIERIRKIISNKTVSIQREIIPILQDKKDNLKSVLYDYNCKEEIIKKLKQNIDKYEQELHIIENFRKELYNGST